MEKLMIVNLIKTKQMLSYTLPEKVKGQIWINDFDDNDNDTFRQLLSVEAGDDKWWIKPNKKVSIVSDNVEIISQNRDNLLFHNLCKPIRSVAMVRYYLQDAINVSVPV